MPTTNKAQRVPSHHLYSATTLSNCISDLDSPILSPKLLYAETFERPSSSHSLPNKHRGAPRLRRKDMREMIGTTTEDEFEALPLAVRRKYFSTLERLRFAQNSAQHSSATPSRNNANDFLAGPEYKKRSVSDKYTLRSPLTDTTRHNTRASPRRLRKLSRSSSVTAADASWFLTLPEKIRKREFSAGEQAQLTGHNQRDSVILDAADEAIYKASRRASRNLSPMTRSAAAAAVRRSMDVTDRELAERPTSVAKAMYESFRWMDEEDDLDLRLVLDDYHANLDGAVLHTPGNAQRPSFRRHMSISKTPFGRTSISSINQTSPVKSPLGGHFRQKSRTMSMTMISPKHAATESLTAIDPHATHYQDPEARLKLRVYLASAQKFDEAIEFGFPSREGILDTAEKDTRPSRRPSREGSAVNYRKPDQIQTFFNDDSVSLFSEDDKDDVSMADPDSPVTPSAFDTTFRALPTKESKTSTDFSHLGIKRPTLHKQVESYTQSMTGTREMTLRMTLTRPDLRADEATIYGWQGARSKSPLGEEPLALGSMSSEKFEMKGPLGGVDGWGAMDKDDSVVRRLWNKVRSSQRKST